MMDWQPIETAPKDGRTLLLGRFNEIGKWRTMRGQWFTKTQVEEEWEADDCEEGWYETSVENDEIPNCWATNPTHWMPLPPPPNGDTKLAAAPSAEPVAQKYTAVHDVDNFYKDEPVPQEHNRIKKENAAWRAALREAILIIKRDVLLCAEDEKHDNELAAQLGDGSAYNRAVAHCENAIEAHIKESFPSDCSCGGSPHTTECAYQHFLAYSGLTDSVDRRHAYFHGAGADCEIKPVAQGGETNAAPTLPTIEWVETLSGMAHKCDVGGEALVKLCNAARIGLQCLQAEPVAWMVHRGEIWNTKMSPYKDEIGQPLIVQPEVLK